MCGALHVLLNYRVFRDHYNFDTPLITCSTALALPSSIQNAISEENDTEEDVECRQSNFRHEVQDPISKLYARKTNRVPI